MTDATTKNHRDDLGRGRLFIVSAPSGAGKTTLCDAAREQLPDLVYSISSTTRLPRKGEKDGVEYFFVTEERFKKGIENDQWLEWAKVHDNYYGTSAQFIRQHLEAGKNVLLDIDVQGAMQIVQRYPEAVTIFIMAPSLAVLRQRLMRRGLDSYGVIEKRMQNAQKEIDSRHLYRHTVVNDDLQTSICEFIRILNGDDE